jgi:hypothetical protein
MNFIAKKIVDIKIILDKEFTNLSDKILADKIYILFQDDSHLEIIPLTDTDEIDVIYCNVLNNLNLNNYVSTLEEFKGKEITLYWNTTNSNGYFDCFMLAFDNLHPSLIILSEGSVLKMFKTIPL